MISTKMLCAGSYVCMYMYVGWLGHLLDDMYYIKPKIILIFISNNIVYLSHFLHWHSQL